MTVRNVTGRSNRWPSDNQLDVQPEIEFELDFEQNSRPAPAWYARSATLTDALGNSSPPWDCRLSPGEAAWKVTMQLIRRRDAQFSDDEIWTFSDLEIPDANTFSTMKLSETIQGLPVALEGIGGAGRVTLQGECSFPCVVFSSGSDRSHELFLIAEDDQGRPVRTDGPMHPGSLQVWFLDLPKDTTTVHLKLVAQQQRSIEFLIDPADVPFPKHLRPLPEPELVDRLAAVTSRPRLYA